MKRAELRRVLEHARRAKGSELLLGEERGQWLNRIQSNQAYASLLDEIRGEAARYLDSETPPLTYTLFQRFFKDGTRQAYEQVYFEKRKRLNAFVLMSLLEPDRAEYRERMNDMIWSICDEYTWCLPAHLIDRRELAGTSGDADTIDLFAAETAFALSEIEALAGDLLPELLRGRIREEVRRRLLRPYKEKGPFHWEKATHNWAAVCAGSIGSTALYMVDDPDELADLLEKVLSTLSCYLQGFGDDGACTEGIEYWTYGFGFYTYFADLLLRFSAGELNLFSSAKVRAIAAFPQKCFLHGNKVANFSDSLPETQIHLGLFHYLHGLFPEVEVPESGLRSAAVSDHCGRWAPQLRKLLWFRPELGGQAWKDGSFYLKDAEWLVSRHSSESGCYAFAAKGGHNEEPHNHNDIGHWLLQADGKPFLIDLGCGQYTRDYFGAKRYDYVCNGSQGHSVPIVNGRHQVSGGAARAQVLNIQLGDTEDQLDLDLGSAYPEDAGSRRLLERWIRRFRWVKSNKPVLHLEDEFSWYTEGSVVERFISAVAGRVESEGLVVLQGEGRSLLLEYDPSLWQPMISPGVFTGHFGEERSFYYIDFHPLGVGYGKKWGSRFTFRFE
jgi:hypothetical protein